MNGRLADRSDLTSTAAQAWEASGLDLMAELKGTTSYLFISHDMAAVAKFCDRIAVMHKGRLVEQGTTRQIISAPQDPYTQSLLEAVPRIGRRR